MKNLNYKGFTQVPNYVVRNPKITPYAKAVYLVLRSFNPCFAGYKCIMELTGINSKSTISSCLRILEKLGLIRISNISKYKSNFYEMCELDLSRPLSELEMVQEVDTNNTNEIIPISNTNGSPAPPKGDDEPLEYSQKFKTMAESLGADAKCGYIEKSRPTMIIG